MAVHTSSVRGLAVYRVSVPAQPCRVDVSVCGCVSVRMCMLVNGRGVFRYACFLSLYNACSTSGCDDMVAVLVGELGGMSHLLRILSSFVTMWRTRGINPLQQQLYVCGYGYHTACRAPADGECVLCDRSMLSVLSSCVRLAFSKDATTGEEVVLDATSEELEVCLSLLGQKNTSVAFGCHRTCRYQRSHTPSCCVLPARAVSHHTMLLLFAFARNSIVRESMGKQGAVELLIGWGAKQIMEVVEPKSTTERERYVVPALFCCTAWQADSCWVCGAVRSDCNTCECWNAVWQRCGS